MRILYTYLAVALLAPLAYAQISLPITFEENIDYEITGFGGAVSELVADPEDSANTVVQTLKTDGAETWAGTTVAQVTGFTEPLPFAPGATTMSVRVWSPLAGIPVRFKVEEVGDPTVSVETEATTTVAEAWETLVFNFASQSPGTAPINYESTYNKASIFFNFGTAGTGLTYYWDDIEFGGEVPPSPISLPITFEEDINYEIVDFGGTVSELVADPEDASNTVVQTLKTDAAETWAGTVVADVSGLNEPIPFEPGSTTMSVRVWSPVAGIPVRLKVEEVGDPTVSVETEATTEVAEAWDTLVFDFANEAPGTAAINFESIYNKVVIFFDFGTSGSASGARTYYWDDIAFGLGVSSEGPVNEIPAVALAQNYPNPVRANTQISFHLSRAEPVALHVYNVIGQRVATLVDAPMDAGTHVVWFDAGSLASGTYFYRLQHGEGQVTRSMVVTR